MIMEAQNAFINTRYDEISPFEYRLNPRYIEPQPHPPNINDRLCCKQLDARLEPIGYRILMEAYMTVTFGADEPDQLWAGGGPDRWTYQNIRELITSAPNAGITHNLTELTYEIRFDNAILKMYPISPGMDEGEILFWNTRHPQMSIRVYNLTVHALLEANNVNR